MELDPEAAAAIVLQLCRVHTGTFSPTSLPPLDAVYIDDSGRVTWTATDVPTDSQRLERAALVLRGLLPDPGGAHDSSTAAGLRTFARRILVEHTGPTTPAELAASLARFVRGNAREDVRDVARRALEAAELSMLDAAADPAAEADPPVDSTSDADDDPLPTPVHVVELGLNEPLPWDLDTVQQGAAAAGAQWWPVDAIADEGLPIEDDPRVAVVDGDGRSEADVEIKAEQQEEVGLFDAAAGHRPGAPARPLLVGGALALAAVIWLLSSLPGTSGATAAPEAAAARNAPAPVVAADANPSRGPGQESPHAQAEAAPAAEDRPSSEAVRAQEGDVEGSARQQNADNAVPAAADSTTPPVPAESPASNVTTSPALTAAHLEPLVTGIEPTFSPSFAPDGRDVYFHAGYEGPSPLMRASATSAAAPDVWRILDDGSRNYHPRVSPDGRLVAFDSDRDGTRGVYVLDLTNHTLRRVSGPGHAVAPSWSPDGSKTLAIVRAEENAPGVWNLWRLDLATGRQDRLTSHRSGQTWSASWFPDGRRIIYSHEDQLMILDTRGGESRAYPSPIPGAQVRTPAVSPDGQHVVFQVKGHGVWMLDLRSGRTQVLLRDTTAEEFAWAPDGHRLAFHSRRDGTWKVWILDTTV